MDSFGGHIVDNRVFDNIFYFFINVGDGGKVVGIVDGCISVYAWGGKKTGFARCFSVGSHFVNGVNTVVGFNGTHYFFHDTICDIVFELRELDAIKGYVGFLDLADFIYVDASCNFHVGKVDVLSLLNGCRAFGGLLDDSVGDKVVDTLIE